MGKHTPIADLMAGYEANGCDHTDMAWVRAAARRYVETMPDSQVRCLLHVLAQEPAEAQAQGGGEVERVARAMAENDSWHGWDTATGCVDTLSGNTPDEERDHYRDLARVAISAMSAPPSAPVGVEGLVAKWRAEADRDGVGDLIDRGHSNGLHSAADELEAALAQQPAAVDGEVVVIDGRRYSVETVKVALLGLAADVARALAAQPEGSDNDR